MGATSGAGGSAPVEANSASRASERPSLEGTRLTLEKWIQTQSLIGKERSDWNQGKDILSGRVELGKKEVTTLTEKIKSAEAAAAKGADKRTALLAENEQLKATILQVTTSVARLEGEVLRLFKLLPDPVRARVQPLLQRIPDDSANTKVSTSERFQNVVGILSAVGKANQEINVVYEVRKLADGKPAEVKTMYVGLAQAYYVSGNGEAGIGRPSEDGWRWEPAKQVAPDILRALEVIQLKHSPVFVPLPVKLQ